MMNDRFSAGLRQHLLETANERPAAGQLESVLERVADTGQRRPLVARLAGFPGRIGPFPSTTVRLALIAAALLVATMGVALQGGGGPPPRSTVFEGTWTSIDPFDESRQTLVVAPGMTPAVHFEDDLTTGGACDLDAIKVFKADGTGRVTVSRLDVSYPFGGGCGLTVVEVWPGFFTYYEATDTLLASDGVRWFRARDDGARPTPLLTPTPASGCIDLNGGGPYAATVGSLTLTAMLPVSTSWEGHPDRFVLSRFGCPNVEAQSYGSPAWIEAQMVTRVEPDACARTGSGLEVDTPAAAIAALAAQTGVKVVGPVDATLGGYSGSRLEYSIPAGVNASACTDGVIAPLSNVNGMDPAGMLTVYVVDVDGAALAVVINWESAETRADQILSAEVDAIIEVLSIEP